MLSILRIARKVLDWLIIAVMLLIGSLVFGCLGNKEIVHARIASLPVWQQVLGYALWLVFSLWFLCPLGAVLLGFKRRAWAGVVWLLGAMPAYISARVLFYVMNWRRSLGWFTPAILVLVAIGLYWLVTAAFKWPPALARPTQPSIRRKLAFVCGAAFICALGFMWMALIAAIPFYIGDCANGPPFTKQSAPYQTMFIATDAVAFVSVSASPGWSRSFLANFAIAQVQEHFWGLPWWDRKFVFLVRPYSWHGEPYLLDANRPSGLLSRFLPIVTIRQCGRSRPLADADIDVRVLKDGKSRLGARVIGRISRESGEFRLKQAGIRVAITGPGGSVVGTTDAKGVYDFPGLSPGSYTIHADLPPKARIDFSGCREPFELEHDEIIECDIGYGG